MFIIEVIYRGSASKRRDSCTQSTVLTLRNNFQCILNNAFCFFSLDQRSSCYYGCRAGVCHPAEHYRQTAV